MGRPANEGMDWFRHQTSYGKTIYILEQRYGNDGYAAWFKLLGVLTKTPGHAYDASAESDWEYLVAIIRAEPERATEIIDLLARLDAIDQKLWNDHKIIWCQKLVDGFEPTYKKRKQPKPTRPEFPQPKPGFQTPKPPFPQPEVQQTGDEPEFPGIVVPESAQSREEKSIKDKDKRNVAGRKKPPQREIDPEATRLAELLAVLIFGHYEQLAELQPGKREGTIARWATDIERAHRLDKREWGELDAVIRWAQQDAFWQRNILSGKKVREQYDKLAMARRKEDDGGSGATGRPRQAHAAQGASGNGNGNGDGKYAGVGTTLNLGRPTQ